MEIKNIIFDFGGVLIGWDPRRLYRDMFDNEVEMEFFLENICNAEWNLKQDAGRSFYDATKELTDKFPRYEIEIRSFYANWTKMIVGPIEENVALLDDLKDKYRLFGLTNWSAEAFPVVFNQYPFFKEFEGIVVSGTEKLVKPDAKIYNLLLTRYGLRANESLFIDDNKENINAAHKLGFKTIHFTEKVNLKNELEKLAI
jgi:2-haloacid dehalogenase